MRSLAPLIVPLLTAGSASAANKCLKLEAFSCGNIARYTHATASQTTTVRVTVYGSDTNQALFYESTHCGAESGHSTWTSKSTCVSQCKTARACSTKVWPEHCDQGCELDCQAEQTATNWNALSVLDTYAGMYTVEVTLTNAGLGRTFACTYTNDADITAVPYCVAFAQSAGLPGAFSADHKLASWPDLTQMDQVGQPWVKVGMESACAGVLDSATARNLPDSPSNTDVSAATRIEGSIMTTGLTCDGHCGTFTPGYGATCSAATAASVQNFGPGWHPSSTSDCYCSCTSDCKKSGDCCDDYNMCSSTDLTVTGGMVNTQAPTHNVNAGGSSGDPFTEHAGKRTQFYLPLGRRVMLLKVRGFELLGEAKPSSKKSDDQQWFKAFEVRYQKKQVAVVEIQDADKLLNRNRVTSESKEAVAAEATNRLAAIRDRLVRAKMELATTEEIRSTVSDDVDIDSTSSSRRALRTSQMPLSSLKVTVDGKSVERESTINLANITVQITQDVNKRVGNAFMDSTWIEAPGVGLVLQSSVAQKFEDEKDKIAHAHVNLKFTELNATAAEGPLPEIWGIRPMSRATSRMLVPLSIQ